MAHNCLIWIAARLHYIIVFRIILSRTAGVHNAPKILGFPRDLVQTAILVAEKAHEQTPQNPNGGTEKKETVDTKVMHEQKIDPSRVYNVDEVTVTSCMCLEYGAVTHR